MSKRATANLLPYPRSLKHLTGAFTLRPGKPPAVKIVQSTAAPDHPEGYALTVERTGITIQFREAGGLRAASATLRQLVREYGRRLPCVKIRDWPDFARRGVMLDISRGKVPSLATLLDLVEKLADLKINEFQVYVEHTFAYRQYKSVWQSWGALTAKEIQILDARCHELGIDLVPNQNSFGHLRYFLEDPRLKKLGELSEPYEVETGEFVRRPTTLAPNHPGTLPFLRGLFDEFLPNFTSKFFNVGCDETWDLGKGQSKARCNKLGQDQVYFDFLKKIHGEVSGRGKTMMFWGDIILKYPKLIRQLPKDAIALNWGYEADHPFNQEAAQFARARIPFYVCPGTSTWQTIIGKHDNGLANLKSAAKVGKKFGALGYLNTDWGDGGHPQPLAVSWPLFAAGAALSWNASGLDEKVLEKVLNRDIYEDSACKIAGAAMRLGLAHKKLGATAINETALGTVIAAPKPEDRELFCRNGLKWFAKIPRKNVIAAMRTIERERETIRRGKYSTDSAMVLAVELDLAARMAVQSCQYMLWQQALAAGKSAEVKTMAREGIRDLQRLEKDFNAYWPMRNKGAPRHSTPFLQWRIGDYSKTLTQS
jgi:hexosaminidase